MWWTDLGVDPFTLPPARLRSLCLQTLPSALVDIAADATLDQGPGPILIGAGTRICPGAYLQGPLVIGSGCMVGNGAMVRGGTYIGNRVCIGFCTEIKGATIEDDVRIGPLCFVADSHVGPAAYLGAQVRTSNHRLDGANVSVKVGAELVDTGREKLGCLIGARCALGVQVIVLPGRSIEADTVVGPRVTVERNFVRGRYHLKQDLHYMKDFE